MFKKVIKTKDLVEGDIKYVEAFGKKLALAREDGEVFCFNDTCSHAECSLSEGWIEDGNVFCPCHGSSFEMKSGKVLSLPATEDIAVYDVREEEGEILVDL